MRALRLKNGRDELRSSHDEKASVLTPGGAEPESRQSEIRGEILSGMLSLRRPRMALPGMRFPGRRSGFAPPPSAE
jgi:hypothetical protein